MCIISNREYRSLEMRLHGKEKYRSMNNTKIGIKGETLTEKMKRSPDKRAHRNLVKAF
jgi:hypothetical protein